MHKNRILSTFNRRIEKQANVMLINITPGLPYLYYILGAIFGSLLYGTEMFP